MRICGCYACRDDPALSPEHDRLVREWLARRRWSWHDVGCHDACDHWRMRVVRLRQLGRYRVKVVVVRR